MLAMCKCFKGLTHRSSITHDGASMGSLSDGPAQRQSYSAPICIVGGAGFIGRRLTTRLLAGGYVVRIVDVVAPQRSDVQYRLADVRDYSGIARAIAGSRVVYNLAAVHRDDVKPASLYREANVDGASNITKACRILGINNIVFTSSVAVYGSGGNNIPEDQAPLPSNDYGRSKLEAEQEYRDWQFEEPADRTLVIVRPCVVFGVGNRGNVHRLLQQIRSRPFVIAGNGENRKSMAYVDNVSAFLTHVITLGPGVHVYNYADKPDFSMNELVATTLRELGRPRNKPFRVPYVIGLLGGLACDFLALATRKSLPISAARVRKFCSTTTFSTIRLRSTGFTPPVCLHDALRYTINQEICNRIEGSVDSPRSDGTNSS